MQKTIANSLTTKIGNSLTKIYAISEFGAVQKTVNLDRSRKILQNELVVAKICADTAESVFSKVSR